MGKNKDIENLTNLMSKSLRHKIGSLVNENELYAAKYAKDAEILMREAEKIAYERNWNNIDKAIIKEKLIKKLNKELEERDFLKDKKFELIDEEVDKALKKFNL